MIIWTKHNNDDSLNKYIFKIVQPYRDCFVRSGSGFEPLPSYFPSFSDPCRPFCLINDQSEGPNHAPMTNQKPQLSSIAICFPCGAGSLDSETGNTMRLIPGLWLVELSSPRPLIGHPSSSVTRVFVAARENSRRQRHGARRHRGSRLSRHPSRVWWIITEPRHFVTAKPQAITKK